MLSFAILVTAFCSLTLATAADSTLQVLSHVQRLDYDVPVGLHRRHHTRGLRKRKCKTGSKASTGTAKTKQAAQAQDNTGTSVSVTASTNSTSVNATVSTGSSSSGSSSKFGRALAWAMDDNLASLFTGSNIKTYYHWENPVVAGLSQMDYLPMLWGSSKLNMFDSVMNKYSDGNLPEWIIGFNEPDLSMQGNMSPEDAAASWKQNIQPYAAKGVKLAAPQLSWNNDWYKAFFAACDGCTFDAIGKHWYGDVNDIGAFKSAITTFWSEFGDKAPEMWVTEYSVTASSGGSEAQVLAFAKESTAFLESLDYVTLKAWFGCWSANPDGYASSNGRFVDNNNQLTEIGKWWIS